MLCGDDRIPVIASIGQVIERDDVCSALDLAERAAHQALSAAPGLATRIQRLSVVGILSSVGRAPATDLARRLRIKPAQRETTTIGGNTPQWLVGRAATAIVAGELDAALIVGAEAMRSERVIRARGGEPSGPSRGGGGDADRVVGDARLGVGDAELAAGLVLPAHIYPLLESVLAARAGRSFAEHREALARLMAPFTQVAAKHPCAWFPEPRTPSEIAEPSPDNRLVAEPYTKRMNAVMGVDQGAALVVCSLAAARAAGVADDSVFVWSSADATDVWYPTARPDLGSSPALAAAGAAALEGAGVGLDDLGMLDLYSCFPVAIEIAADALGLPLTDRRGLTVTGGLPYFGGPGNNYVTHALATLVDRLRTSPGLGLVTGLGWYVTKHSVGVYGSDPPPRGYVAADVLATQQAIDASELPVASDGVGTGIVQAATVVYDAEGRVTGAPVIATLDDGRRVAAACGLETELQQLAGESLVGARVDVLAGRSPTFRLR